MPRFSFFAGVAAALILTACSSGGSAGSDLLTLGPLFGSSAPGNTGYAVGDEPYAVKAGAAILDQGGSAADAAAAIYFALAVTYPVAAGLGGGGLCVVYDAAGGRSQAIDFLARDAAQGGAFAVPGNVRGFAALHAGYGNLPWQRDVALGESMASSGFPISGALVARLQDSQNVVRLDTNLSAEFLDESGHLKPAGTVVANPALAGTLTAIREHGADAFYGASIAEKIVTYSSGEGGAISAADLAAYRAGVRDPQIVTMGSERAYLPPANVGAGSFAAAILSLLVNTGGTPKAAGNAAVETAAVIKKGADVDKG